MLIAGPKRPPSTDFKVAWISTRRGHDAADAISANLLHRYHLHSLIRSVTAPLTELSAADAVMLEIPPTADRGYEHTILDLVNRIIPQCAKVTIIVQPSLRRKSERPTWVQRWNLLHNTPFKFRRTCSCKLGNHVPNCHFTFLVGSTAGLELVGCAEVATLSASHEALALSLGGALSSIATCVRLATRSCYRPGRDASRDAGDGRGSPVAASFARLPELASALRREDWGKSQQAPDSVISTPSVTEPPVAGSAVKPRHPRRLVFHQMTESSVSPETDTNTDTQYLFPTDAKAREKERRKEAKEAGNERVVKKRKKSWRITMMIAEKTYHPSWMSREQPCAAPVDMTPTTSCQTKTVMTTCSAPMANRYKPTQSILARLHVYSRVAHLPDQIPGHLRDFGTAHVRVAARPKLRTIGHTQGS